MYKMQARNNWQPFYFESEYCRGWIRWPEDWEEVKEYHPLSKLERAKSWDRGGIRRAFFGFTLQCRKGKMTLKEFFEKHNMEM